jgi:hypothetical protein
VLLLSTACSFDLPAVEPEDAGSPVIVMDAKIDPDASDPTDAGFEDAAPPSADAGEDASPGDVPAMNQRPIAVDDRAATRTGRPATVDVLANDSDPDGDPLAILSVGTAQNGTATLQGLLVVYTPAAQFAGRDQLTYMIDDGRGGTASAQLVVDVIAPLEITPPALEMNANSRATFSSSGGVPPVTFSIASGGGTIDPATGELFTPFAVETIIVQARDAMGQTATATVTCTTCALYYIGGVGPTSDSSAVFRSATGMSWTNSGSLPSPRYLHASVVFEDAIYVAGGRTDGTNAFDDVYRSTDGTSFTAIGTIPVRVRGAQLIVLDRRLMLIGGRDAADFDRSEVWASTDGIAWSMIGMLPVERSFGGAAVLDGVAYYVGGEGFNASARVFESLDGVMWNEVAALPAARRHAAVVAHEGAIWVAGGNDNSPNGVTTVWGSNGATWDAKPALPVGLGGMSGASFGGRLVGIGGTSDQIPANGTNVARRLETTMWIDVGLMASPRFWGTAVVFKP